MKFTFCGKCDYIHLDCHYVAHRLHIISQRPGIRKGEKIMKSVLKNKKTVIDPVCNMEVIPTITEIKTILNGDTYYFCAESCKQAFVDNPEKYLNPKAAKKKGWWCRYTERLEKSTGGKAMKCH